MMSLNTHNNINFAKELTNKFAKHEDSKLEAYILKKQVELSMNNNFIKVVETPHPLSPMKLKAQVEELQKLQSEVSYMENRIRELELAKKVKLVKVK
jgi:hypothetical protein